MHRTILAWARRSSHATHAALALVGSGLAADQFSTSSLSSKLLCDAPPERSYTEDEVASRNGQNGAETWVTLGDRVYNITRFVDEHKGGNLIRTAAGGPIEDYWAYWAYHLTLDEPRQVLKQFEIGRLQRSKDKDDDDNDDGDKRETLQEKLDSNYESDPDRAACVRHGQTPLTVRPWCSETAPKQQQSLYTNNRSFYVRNHAPVPRLDYEDHDITLSAIKPGEEEDQESNDHSEIALSLRSLGQRYALVYVSSALQCAGNRTKDLRKIAPTAFEHTPYRDLDRGMMGNALWSGYRLADILVDAFPWLKDLSQAELQQWHVEFEGADQYRTSTPLARILDPSNDCLIAIGMNGEELPPDHGFPCRVLLPGIAGARSVKWVHNIRVSRKECDSCFQQTYYLDPHGKAIQGMPLQSFLTTKEKLDNEEGNWMVRGVAWGGSSGAGVGKIELSSDQGKTWTEVPLSDQQTASNRASPMGGKDWSWVVFETIMKTDPNAESDPKFLCRIVDKNGVQQPQMLWYPKGYLSNPWHEL